jgi:tRNA(fMet)-specific endonuclease VapC
MQYLRDTNICIYIIKRKPQQVLKKFESFSLGEIGISSITLAKLEFGINKSPNRERNKEALNQFIIPLEILTFDYNAAIEYGKIRSELENKGTPIGPLDTLIGAHALSLNVTLVTNNEREFKRINNLKVENWIDVQ